MSNESLKLTKARNAQHRQHVSRSRLRRLTLALDLNTHRDMRRSIGTAIVVTIALVLACSGKESPPTRLRGPLAALLLNSRISLPCDSVARQYAVPFWRAPYRSC